MADILEAALRVLDRDGGARFTTVRVAEEAGVSIGSLYQYFPNKAALLFRLQTDEWKQTGGILEEIFMDPTRAPLDRLRRAVQTFLRSEREEAELRKALASAGEGFDFADAAPEIAEHRTTITERTRAFFAIALPHVPEAERVFAAEVVMTSMSAVGKNVTEQGRSRAEIDAWSKSLADMYCGYLERLEKEHAPRD